MHYERNEPLGFIMTATAIASGAALATKGITALIDQQNMLITQKALARDAAEKARIQAEIDKLATQINNMQAQISENTRNDPETKRKNMLILSALAALGVGISLLY